MPSPEHFYQPQPFDAPHTDHGELAAQPPTSPRMEQVVTQLAAAHGADLSQKGATLTLDVPEQKQRWLIGTIDQQQRIGVTRLHVAPDNTVAPDLDIVLEQHPEGWEPVEIVHSEAAWQDYRKDIPTDEKGDFSFATFADTVAQDLEQHEWVTKKSIIVFSDDKEAAC